jgi:hypothetical protein
MLCVFKFGVGPVMGPQEEQCIKDINEPNLSQPADADLCAEHDGSTV